MRLPSSAEIQRHVLAMPHVRLGIEFIAREVESECTGLADQRAFDQGTYASMIKITPWVGAGMMVSATDRKSRWLERGTGIYGPAARPIRPLHGKFLVFRVPTGAPLASMSGTRNPGDLVFAREVKGRPPSWVMRDGSRIVAERHGLRWVNLSGGSTGWAAA